MHSAGSRPGLALVTGIPAAIARCPPPVFALRRVLSTTQGGGGGGDNNNHEQQQQQQLQAARTWLAKLHAETIPLSTIGELSFSRSSGPGGQNVNKYDTGAKILRRARY